MLGEKRVITGEADVFTRLEEGAALPHDDGAARNQLAAENLYAEPLRVGVAAVFRTA